MAKVQPKEIAVTLLLLLLLGRLLLLPLCLLALLLIPSSRSIVQVGHGVVFIHEVLLDVLLKLGLPVALVRLSADRARSAGRQV